jgi:hypothetical protein
MSVSSKGNSDKPVGADRRNKKETSARHQSALASSDVAEVEEAAGQARVIVDHDWPVSDGLIWNHFKFLTQAEPPRQSIDRRGHP